MIGRRRSLSVACFVFSRRTRRIDFGKSEQALEWQQDVVNLSFRRNHDLGSTLTSGSDKWESPSHMVVWKEPTSFIARLSFRTFSCTDLDDPHLARGVRTLRDTGTFGASVFLIDRSQKLDQRWSDRDGVRQTVEIPRARQ